MDHGDLLLRDAQRLDPFQYPPDGFVDPVLGGAGLFGLSGGRKPHNRPIGCRRHLAPAEDRQGGVLLLGKRSRSCPK